MHSLCGLVVALLLVGAQKQLGTAANTRCEPIVDVVYCADVGYENCSLPNIRGHETQLDVQAELNGFELLIKDSCSNALVHFLCSVYAPFCSGNIQLQPCKNLCLYVRSTCAPRMAEFNMLWPPHLECEQYPEYGGTDLCFGLEDPSLLQIPDYLLGETSTSPSSSVTPVPSTSRIPNVTDEECSCTAVVVGVFFSEFTFFLVTNVVAVLVTYFVGKKRFMRYSLKDPPASVPVNEMKVAKKQFTGLFEQLDVATYDQTQPSNESH